MFNTCSIKNAKRTTEKKIPSISIDDCSIVRPDERTMPFFDVVPEQVLADLRYNSLSNEEQGQFWRLVIHVMAPDGGMSIRHSGVIAKRLKTTKSQWENIEHILIEKGLLIVTSDENYLLQHELREQYLQTLEINNAKRRT